MDKEQTGIERSLWRQNYSIIVDSSGDEKI